MASKKSLTVPNRPIVVVPAPSASRYLGRNFFQCSSPNPRRNTAADAAATFRSNPRDCRSEWVFPVDDPEVLASESTSSDIHPALVNGRPSVAAAFLKSPVFVRGAATEGRPVRDCCVMTWNHCYQLICLLCTLELLVHVFHVWLSKVLEGEILVFVRKLQLIF